MEVSAKPWTVVNSHKASDTHPLPDYLAAGYHRKGIMTDAIDTVLHDWAIPRMNVRHMLLTVFEDNEGSVKVFLRNGFKLKGTYKDHHEVKGKIRGVHLLEWRYSEIDRSDSSL